MQYDSKILDDLTRLVTGIVGSVAGVQREIESQLREQCGRILAQLDVVTREEFEVTRAMAIKLRREQEELRDRLTRLESLMASAATEPAVEDESDKQNSL